MRPTTSTELESLLVSAEALPQREITTEAQLQSTLTSLKRAHALNSKLRLRHANEPARFLQSEVSLDDAVRALAPVAVSPALFPALISHGALQQIRALLSHANEDILYRSISFLHDLTVVDDGETMRDEIRSLYDALLKVGIFEVLTHALEARLLPQIASPDTDDASPAQEAVAQTFSVFEVSLDARPDLANAIATQSKIIQTCIRQVSSPEISSEAIDLLAVILQNTGECRHEFVKHSGINAVLEALAPFRNSKKLKKFRDVTAGGDSKAEREELAQNMFGVLCSSLLGGTLAKNEFVRREGVELMVSFMRSSKSYRGSAVKVLDFACTGHAPSVQTLLQCGGVGVVFAVLQKIGEEGNSKSGDKRRRSMHEEELKTTSEHVLGVIFSMLRYASAEDRRRLLLKLREDGAVKTRMVVSLYRHFALGVEKECNCQGRFLLTEGENPTDKRQGETDDADLIDMLEEGLLAVQMGAVIVGDVLVHGDEDLKRALMKMLPQVGMSVALICRTMEGYAKNIEGGLDDEEKAEAERERRRIHDLVKVLLKSVERLDS